jgi:hypothetical protein
MSRLRSLAPIALMFWATVSLASGQGNWPGGSGQTTWPDQPDKVSDGVYAGLPTATINRIDYQYAPFFLDFGMKGDYNAYSLLGGSPYPYFGLSAPEVSGFTKTCTTVSGSRTLSCTTAISFPTNYGMLLTGTGMASGAYVDDSLVAGIGPYTFAMSSPATSSNVGVTITFTGGTVATTGFPRGASGTGGISGAPASGQYLFEQQIGDQPAGNFCGADNGALNCALSTIQNTGIDWRTSGNIQTTMDGDGSPSNNATILGVEIGLNGGDENNYVLAYGYNNSASPTLTTAGAITGNDFAGFRFVCTVSGGVSTGVLTFVTQRASTLGAATTIASDVPCGATNSGPGLALQVAFRVYGDFTNGTGGAIITCGGYYVAKCATTTKTLTGVASASVVGTSFLMPSRTESAGYGIASNRYYFHMAGVSLATGAMTVSNNVAMGYLLIANTMQRL